LAESFAVLRAPLVALLLAQLEPFWMMVLESA